MRTVLAIALTITAASGVISCKTYEDDKTAVQSAPNRPGQSPRNASGQPETSGQTAAAENEYNQKLLQWLDTAIAAYWKDRSIPLRSDIEALRINHGFFVGGYNLDSTTAINRDLKKIETVAQKLQSSSYGNRSELRLIEYNAQMLAYHFSQRETSLRRDDIRFYFENERDLRGLINDMSRTLWVAFSINVTRDDLNEVYQINRESPDVRNEDEAKIVISALDRLNILLFQSIKMMENRNLAPQHVSVDNELAAAAISQARTWQVAIGRYKRLIERKFPQKRP